MSHELDYFPPNKTKWKWGAKVLRNKEWWCDLSHQREAGLDMFPASVDLTVDLIDGKYWWRVSVRNFSYKDSELNGTSKDPLKACLRAEKVGEAMLDKLLPDWARTALKNKWRPPA
jgi:hypothetical protein